MASWLHGRLFCDKHDTRLCDVIDDIKNDTDKERDHGKETTSSSAPPPPATATVTLPVTVTAPATIVPPTTPPAPAALASTPTAAANPPSSSSTSRPNAAPTAAALLTSSSPADTNTAAALAPQVETHPASSSSSSSSITAGQLVAASVGLVAFLLAALAGLFVFWFRRRRRRALHATGTARRRLRLGDERTRSLSVHLDNTGGSAGLGGAVDHAAAAAARGPGAARGASGGDRKSPTSTTSRGPASKMPAGAATAAPFLPRTRAAGASADDPVQVQEEVEVAGLAHVWAEKRTSADECAAVGVAAPLSIRRVRLVEVGSERRRGAGHGGRGGGGGGVGGEAGSGRGVQIVHVGDDARAPGRAREQPHAPGPDVALAMRPSRLSRSSASSPDGGGCAPGVGSTTAQTVDPFSDPLNVVHG